MGSSVILPAPGQPATGPDKSFRSAVQANVVSFATKSVGPPSTAYVRQDDLLLCSALTSLPGGDTVTFFARLLEAVADQPGQPDAPTPPGAPGFQTSDSQTIKLFNSPIILTQFNQQSILVSLAEGYLLNVGARSPNAGGPGQTWVNIGLLRGALTQIQYFQSLAAGYVTGAGLVGWPAGRIQGPVEGPGQIVSVQVANPAAGADWVLLEPAHLRRRIISMEAQIAVANSGAARPIEIVVDDGVNIVARMATNVGAAINATSNVNFSNAGTPSTAIATDLYAQMPGTLVLDPGHRIRSVTTNIVAGDQWSNIWFLCEQWLEV